MTRIPGKSQQHFLNGDALALSRNGEIVASAAGDVRGLLAGVALLWIGASWLRRLQQRRAIQASQTTGN